MEDNNNIEEAVSAPHVKSLLKARGLAGFKISGVVDSNQTKQGKPTKLKYGEIDVILYPDESLSTISGVEGGYNIKKGAVEVSFNPNKVTDLTIKSVVMHELIHAIQDKAGVDFSRYVEPGKTIYSKLAYMVQDIEIVAFSYQLAYEIYYSNHKLLKDKNKVWRVLLDVSLDILDNTETLIELGSIDADDAEDLANDVYSEVNKEVGNLPPLVKEYLTYLIVSSASEHPKADRAQERLVHMKRLSKLFLKQIVMYGDK